MERMIALTVAILWCIFSFGQSVSETHKMDWFADARLGIFIHWGIYSVEGVDESWAFYNNKMRWTDYMKQIHGFRAENYDPSAWASLIKKSGARYAVITAKHHDGVALWNTKMGYPDPANHHHTVVNSLPQSSPCAEDVLVPFVDALRGEGLRTGIYFSLIDWSYPDYPAFTRDSTRYTIASDSARWQKFIVYCHGQINELIHACHPDLWWFDGDWEHSAEEWNAPAIRSAILADNPNAVLNGRLAGHGDYGTPEQSFPVHRPSDPYWELCLTTNLNWGYQPSDTVYKSPQEIITIFADVLGQGGNLLLDIGPKADGTIPDAQANILTELGTWTSKNSPAIFGTRAGIPPGYFYGPTTLSPDSTRLYLFLPGHATGSVEMKGLMNTIRSAHVVDTADPTPGEIPFKVVGKISWSPNPGLVFLEIPTEVADTYMTVIELELDGPIRLSENP